MMIIECRDFYVIFLIIIFIIIIISYNYSDSVFQDIYNKIDEDINEYMKCKRNRNNILLCGRNKTKYTIKTIKIK